MKQATLLTLKADSMLVVSRDELGFCAFSDEFKLNLGYGERGRLTDNDKIDIKKHKIYRVALSENLVTREFMEYFKFYPYNQYGKECYFALSPALAEIIELPFKEKHERDFKEHVSDLEKRIEISLQLMKEGRFKEVSELPWYKRIWKAIVNRY